jgi:hypothetical protein
MGWLGAKAIASKVHDAMAIPAKLHAVDLTIPKGVRPTAKNDAQAMKVTQTGMGRAVAVK